MGWKCHAFIACMGPKPYTDKAQEAVISIRMKGLL